MCVSALVHLGLVQDLVLLGQINAGILFRRRTSTSDQDFSWAQSDGSGALVEFMTSVIRELFNCPLVLIHVVAETDLRVDIVSKQVDVSLVLWASVERWELEQGLLDGSIVINMNSVLEHVVNKVWVWLDEVVKGAQNFQIFSLLLIEKVEANLILIELHFVDSRLEFVLLVLDHLFSLLDLLFLFLQLFDFLINLFFHHLEQVLVLDLELVHDPSKALLKLVDFLVELLPNFHFELVVELLVD